MASLKATLRGSKSVQKTLRDLRAMFETETDEVNKIIGTEAVRGVQRTIRAQHGPNGEPWAPLVMRQGVALRDTGALYNSITYEAPLGSKTVRIGTNRIQASLMHFGGVVTPKRKKYLAIPANKRIRREYSGDFRRDFPGAFVRKFRDGSGLGLFRKRETRSGRSSIELIAYLRQSVRIPARPFLGVSSDTWREILSRIEKRVGVVAKQAAEPAGDPLAFFGGAK
jgi:phage gpG-like protein